VRRLPVYLLLDTSGSMRGEPIEAVNTGISVMVSALRQDPHALESVYVSIITFDIEAKIVVPLTALDELQVPHIDTPQSGPTHLGLALETLGKRVRQELRYSTAEQKGDWAPFLFVMTDGKPSDIQLYEQQCPHMRSIGFASIIGCVAGPKARKEDLEPLCDHVVALDTMDTASFSSFFKWISSAISGGNRSMGTTGAVPLPPAPREIQLVF
jgi:uncharacterized protein YegL